MSRALAFLIGHLLLALGLGAAAIALVRSLEQPPQPTVLVEPTRVDFPLCVTVKPPALLEPPPGTHEYRLGRGRKDGGTT